MLNERQKKIIAVLRDSKQWKTGRELSELFQVSDRTIRSDIEHINKNRNILLIESNKKFGYRICVHEENGGYFNDFIECPQTTQQRCIFIIYKLMFVNEEVSLHQLSEELFLGLTSIERELKEVKTKISAYSTLKMVRRKNYITLQGTEHQKRIMYADLIISKHRENILNLDCLEKEFEGISVSIVREEMMRVLRKYNYYIHGEEIPYIVIRISINIKRIARHKYIDNPNPKELGDWRCEYSAEYLFMKEFYETMRKYSYVDIVPESELIYSALLFASKKRNTFQQNDTADYIIKKSRKLVNEIFLEIDRRFDIDLSYDDNLRERLLHHIAQMIARKQNRIEVCDFYKKEIKGRYPLFFEMAVCAGKVIKEKENIDIEEEDISFLAQHIGASHSKKDMRDKYQVWMIYPMNQALSALCGDKIKKVFYDKINIIGCDNYFEGRKIQQVKPDLIITTLPLQHDLNILTVQISLFVSIEDESKIFQALSYLDNKRDKLKFQRTISKMMEEQFFFMNLNMENPTEVIEFLCDKMMNAGYVGQDFLNDVIRREQMSPTSFAYSFAIPHPLSSQSLESKIAVAILNHPIPWGEFSVKLVFLLAISEADRKELSTFFGWLGRVVHDTGKISALIKAESYKDFMSEINSLSY